MAVLNWSKMEEMKKEIDKLSQLAGGIINTKSSTNYHKQLDTAQKNMYLISERLKELKRLIKENKEDINRLSEMAGYTINKVLGRIQETSEV